MSTSDSTVSPPSSPGSIRVKCTLQSSDLHVFSLESSEQHEFESLCKKLKSAFGIRTTVHLNRYRITYKDEENDDITIANTQDLEEACRIHTQVLKLNLASKHSPFVGGHMGASPAVIAEVAAAEAQHRASTTSNADSLDGQLGELRIRKESASSDGSSAGRRHSMPYVASQSKSSHYPLAKNSLSASSNQAANHSMLRMSLVNGLGRNSHSQTPLAGPSHPLYKFWHRGEDSEELLNRRNSKQASPNHSPRVSNSATPNPAAMRGSESVNSTSPPGLTSSAQTGSGFRPYKGCMYFASGACKKGDACTFSHDPQLCIAQAQSGLIVPHGSDSRRHSTGGSTGPPGMNSGDGLSTPQRRAFHQQNASFGGEKLFAPMTSGTHSPGGLRGVMQGVGTILTAQGVQRTHYRSEHGTEKADSSKSWRRAGDAPADGNKDANANAPSTAGSQNQSAANSKQTSPKGQGEGATSQSGGTPLGSSSLAASRNVSPTKSETKE